MKMSSVNIECDTFFCTFCTFLYIYASVHTCSQHNELLLITAMRQCLSVNQDFVCILYIFVNIGFNINALDSLYPLCCCYVISTTVGQIRKRQKML